MLLGDATLPNMQVVPATVFSNADVHLRVWFNDGANGWQLLTPDQRIAAVGYAMMAGTTQTVPDGAITTAKIAVGAVGSSQLAPNAVPAGNIASGAVGTTQPKPGGKNAAPKGRQECLPVTAGPERRGNRHRCNGLKDCNRPDWRTGMPCLHRARNRRAPHAGSLRWRPGDW